MRRTSGVGGGERETEDAALTEFRLYPNLPAVVFDDLLAHGQGRS